jgi:A118 family predicted phage portal protein
MNIFQRGLNWIKERMGMGNSEMAVKDVFKESGIRSGGMERLQRDCRAFYQGKAPHNNEKVPSLRLPVTICTEVGRDIYTNSRFGVRAVGDVETVPFNIGFLDEQLRRFTTRKLLPGIVKCLADGTIALRTFYKHGKIHTVISPISNFVVLSVGETGEATSIAFKTKKVIGEEHFTLYEIQTFAYNENNEGFMLIRYQAFKSDSADSDGTEIAVTDVPGWERYEGMQEPIRSDYPWFCVVRTPLENTVDENESVYGVPLYAYALDFIKRADLHFARTEREMKVTAAKVFTNHKFARIAKDADGKPVKGYDGAPIYLAPEDEDELYILFDGESQETDKFIEIFNPDPRVPLFNQYMEQLRRIIEFNSGQSYGTISENPTVVTPSPTQLNATKRRNVRLNEQLQETWTDAVTQLTAAMHEIAVYAGFIQRTEYELDIEWDASLAIDAQLEIAKQKQNSDSREQLVREVTLMLTSGIISKEDAREMLYGNRDVPEQEGLYPDYETGTE